ncbi:MAG: hypothetical protein R3222_04955 [Balneolaceae bacterium]|nr:hypothetical protein [Balneolaceae bacterium]
MNTQEKYFRFRHSDRVTIRSALSAFLLLLLMVVFSPTKVSAESWDSWNPGQAFIAPNDTLEKSVGELPLSQNKEGKSRPRFETVHLQLGLGGTVADYADLGSLGIDKPNFSLPLSLYTYIPFQRHQPGFFILSGADVNLSDPNNFAFKMLLMFQSRPGILFGLGAARTSYVYQEAVVIEADQTQGLLALGINLSPQRVDLLLTMPLAKSLETRFEQNNYSIRLAGIQVSLLVSLR